MAAGSSGYTRTAVSLHWLIAGLMIAAFALGWVMTELAISPLKVKMYNWHKWVGMTVLGLAAIRTLWRLTHAAPPLLPMPVWQQISAHILHALLYVLMFALPFSGWAYSNAAGYPIVYLGLWRLPDLVAKSKPLAAQLLEVHEALGWVLFALVTAHAAAVLKHHLIDRDDTLRRMCRWQAGRSPFA
jgi:cytochrome b561